MKKKASIGSKLMQFVMPMILVILLILFQVLTGGVLLTSTNVFNLINQNAYIIVLAVGMLMCILTGGNVDLSVGSIMAFASAVMGSLMVNKGVNPYLAIIIGLLIGLAVGCWHGFWIAFVKVPPFIATLAGQLIFRGATMMVLEGGKTIAPLPEQFTALGSGYIGNNEIAGTICLIAGVVIAVVFLVMQLIGYNNKKRNGYEVEKMSSMIIRNVVIAAVVVLIFWRISIDKGVPTVLITAGIVALVYNYFTQRTVMGRHLYALGGNAKAAKLSGVKTDRMMFFAYANMGFLSAVAAVLYAARTNAAAAAAGNGAELDAIASCFVGGASAAGGVGTVSGVLVGSLILGVLNNGMSILGMGMDMQKAIKGLVLLAAIAMDVITKQKTLTPMIDNIRRKLSKNK